MKKYKSLIIVIVLVLVLNMYVYKVNAGTTYNIDVSNINYVYRSSYGFVYFGVGAESWGNTGSLSSLSSGSNSIHVYNDSGYDNYFSNVNIKTTNTSWALWFGLSAGTYYIDITCNNAKYYDTTFGNTWILNGHFFGKAVIPSSGAGSINNYTISFKLIYNNDYNYTSNKASFTMQYSNFSFNYFSFLNTDIAQGQLVYGYHLLNYNINQYTLNCSFDNTYETMQNPHYLFYVVHGLDYNGNPIDVSGSISFNINVDTLPKVKNYKVSYVMDGSPCISGSGGGRLYLYIDYGSGYVLQDVSKWSATITQIANGGQDNFSYGVPEDFNTFYRLSIVKVDDIDTYNYDIYVNDTAKHLTGQLNVCANSDYVYDSYGNKSSGQETDIFTLLKEIKDIFIGLWNLILSIVDFFGALLIAIFSIAYSMGVAVISLLKIVVDFVASVSSILFNRNTNYYSLVNVMSLPNSFTYQGKVIGLSGLWGAVDNQLKWVHDNIVINYSGLWAVIALIYLIKKHILIEKVEDEDNE